MKHFGIISVQDSGKRSFYLVLAGAAEQAVRRVVDQGFRGTPTEVTARGFEDLNLSHPFTNERLAPVRIVESQDYEVVIG